MKLEITHPRIIEFYKRNPSLDFQTMNLMLVEMLDRVLCDTDTSDNPTLNTQLLTNIHELKNSVITLNKSMQTMQQETANHLYTRFLELKTGYLEELKMIVQHNTNENIGQLLEKNNNALIDKTNIIINDVVPKNQHNYYTQIQDSIRSFHKSLSDDTRMLMKYIDSNSIKEYISHFEMKSAMMLQNIQQPIYSCIASSEERIKENIHNHHTAHQKMVSEWSDFMKQYKLQQPTSKNTQSVSIANTCNLFNLTHIHVILNKMYSTSEVSEIKPANVNNNMNNDHIFSSALSSQNQNHKETQTFIMKRPNKPKVLIHNIDIENNVNEDHINNFIKSVELNHCHGILLSQNSGIVGKPNYHIEIHNKMLLVYIHNVDYMTEKIKAGMDIIDNLSMRMKEITQTDEYSVTIEKEVLEEINKEYQLFIQHKETMANILKESMKKIFAQMEEFKFPSLEKYLYSKFSTQIQKQGFKCELCKQFLANNLKALAAHKRGCNRKIQLHNGVSVGSTSVLNSDFI